MGKRPKTYGAIAALIAWLFLIAGGWFLLSQYENTPVKAPQPPPRWPVESRLVRASGEPVLLMFAHPRCPCTAASISELSLLMTHCAGKVKAYVLFIRPKGFPADWVKTGLWRSVRAIPGVQAVVDDEGREARRFHARVSGQVALYDAWGDLLFSGGITAARGHAGDNDGRSAIESFLNLGVLPINHTRFFGCMLFNTEPDPPQEGKDALWKP